MSDPNELMSASEIAPMFGQKWFKEGSFRRLGIPVVKTLERNKGVGNTPGRLRFAYRSDVEAAHARWVAEKTRKAQRLQIRNAARTATGATPAAIAAQDPRDAAIAALLRATEELARTVSVLAGRIETLERTVHHLSDLWEPPTTTPAVNGTAHC